MRVRPSVSKGEGEREEGNIEGNLHVRQKANATIPLEGGGRTPDTVDGKWIITPSMETEY